MGVADAERCTGHGVGVRDAERCTGHGMGVIDAERCIGHGVGVVLLEGSCMPLAVCGQALSCCKMTFTLAIGQHTAAPQYHLFDLGQAFETQ